jgi:hypothetical protein
MSISELATAALEEARKDIANRFQDPNDLDDIDTMRLNMQKQLSSVEAQLNNSVTSKLDALRRGVKFISCVGSPLPPF